MILRVRKMRVGSSDHLRGENRKSKFLTWKSESPLRRNVGFSWFIFRFPAQFRNQTSWKISFQHDWYHSIVTVTIHHRNLYHDVDERSPAGNNSHVEFPSEFMFFLSKWSVHRNLTHWGPTCTRTIKNSCWKSVTGPFLSKNKREIEGSRRSALIGSSLIGTQLYC